MFSKSADPQQTYPPLIVQRSKVWGLFCPTKNICHVRQCRADLQSAPCLFATGGKKLYTSNLIPSGASNVFDAQIVSMVAAT